MRQAPSNGADPYAERRVHIVRTETRSACLWRNCDAVYHSVRNLLCNSYTHAHTPKHIDSRRIQTGLCGAMCRMDASARISDENFVNTASHRCGTSIRISTRAAAHIIELHQPMHTWNSQNAPFRDLCIERRFHHMDLRTRIL